MFDLDFIKETKNVIRWGVILTEAGLNKHNIMFNRTSGLTVAEYQKIEEVLKNHKIELKEIKV